MNVRYRVELSQAERAELTTLLSRGKHAARKLKRAQILVAADAGASDDEIARAVATKTRASCRWREAASNSATTRKPPWRREVCWWLLSMWCRPQMTSNSSRRCWVRSAAVLTRQVSELAIDLPLYQATINAKLDDLRPKSIRIGRLLRVRPLLWSNQRTN